MIKTKSSHFAVGMINSVTLFFSYCTTVTQWKFSSQGMEQEENLFMEECLMVSAHVHCIQQTQALSTFYIKSKNIPFLIFSQLLIFLLLKILKVLPDLSGQMIHFRKRTISNSQSFCWVCDLLLNDMYSGFILRPVIIMD